METESICGSSLSRGQLTKELASYLEWEHLFKWE